MAGKATIVSTLSAAAILILIGVGVVFSVNGGRNATRRLTGDPVGTEARSPASVPILINATAQEFEEPIAGKTYYLATNGKDKNKGTKKKKPFLTLARAVSVLKPGDTLLIRAGEYVASSQIAETPSGTSWANPVTIKSFPDETPTLRPEPGETAIAFRRGKSYIVIDGFLIDAAGGHDGIKINNGNHHIRIVNCEIKNASNQGIITADKAMGTGFNEFINCRVHDNGTRQNYDHGFYLETDNELVDKCQVYNNAAYGIHIYADDASNITVRNSEVFGHHKAAGILVGTGNGHKIYNNIVYNNAWGIAIFYGGGGAVFNNTVCDNDAFGIYVCCQAAASTIDNNIVFGNGGAGIFVEDTTVADQTCRNNLSVKNGGGDLVDRFQKAVGTNNLIGDQFDPRFVDAAAHDYRLRAGSSAIDAGLTIETLTTDARGNSRPQGVAFDIGAYERAP